MSGEQLAIEVNAFLATVNGWEVIIALVVVTWCLCAIFRSMRGK